MKQELPNDDIDVDKKESKENHDKTVKKLIIFSFAVVITLMLIVSLLLSSSMSFTEILKFWFDFIAVGAAIIGIEKLAESEFGAALVFFGAVAVYIIYCLW